MRKKRVKPQAVVSGIVSGAYDSPIENFPARPRLDEDQSFLLDQSKHRVMVSDCRYIATTSLVSGALRSKADWSVGDAWAPKFVGKSTQWATRALASMTPWTRNPTGTGDVLGWTRCVDIACVSVDRDGEVFAVKTTTEDGRPEIQFLESHRIGTPGLMNDTTVPSTVPIYSGMKCCSGIILDARRRRVGYNVLPESGYFRQLSAGWNIIPSSSVCHIYDPTFFTQVRGIPSLASGLPDWYSQNDILDAEKVAQRVLSKLTLLEENQSGKQEDAAQKIIEARRAGTRDPNKIDMTVRTFENGMIRYIKSGNNLKAMENNRPSGNWKAFMDYVTRSAFVGMGWPMEIVTGMSGVGSAGVRSINSNAQAAVRRRQDVLYPHFLELWRWRIASAIQAKEIPFVNDWADWDFTFPPQFSIDNGYDSKADSERIALGQTSMSEVIGRTARNFDEVINEKKTEYQKAKAMSDETGIPLPYLYNPLAVFSNGQVANMPQQTEVPDA